MFLSLSLLLVGSLVSLVYLLHIWQYVKAKFFLSVVYVKNGKSVPYLPYPKVPLLNELRFQTRDPYIDINERLAAGGPEKHFINFVYGEPRVVMVNTDSIRELLTASDKDYIRPTAIVPYAERLFGKSILAASGEAWQRQHRLLYKAFGQKNLRAFIPVMKEETQKLIERLKQQDSKPVMMDLLLGDLALRIVTRCAFAFESSDDPRIAAVIKNFSIIAVGMARLIYAFNPINKYFGWLTGARKVEEAFTNMNAIVESIIEERKARKLSSAGKDGDTTEGICYLIDLLIQARDSEDGRGLTDEEIRDNAIVFLIAGSETTSVTMTWFFAHMCQNKDIFAKVIKEVDAALPDPTAFSQEHLEVFPFLQQSVMETLRLTPSVNPIFPRILPEARTIGGVRIPKSLRVVIHPLLVHQDADNYPNPRKFDPTRFEPTAIQARHPYAFIPFGSGRRFCIGRLFALEEISTVLPLLVRSMNFDLKPGSVIEPRSSGVTIRVKDHLELLCTPRL